MTTHSPSGYRLERGKFMKLMKQAGADTDSAIARHMGIHKTTIGRILNGKNLAGPAFRLSFQARYPHLSSDDYFKAPTRKTTR